MNVKLIFPFLNIFGSKNRWRKAIEKEKESEREQERERYKEVRSDQAPILLHHFHSLGSVSFFSSEPIRTSCFENFTTCFFPLYTLSLSFSSSHSLSLSTTEFIDTLIQYLEWRKDTTWHGNHFETNNCMLFFPEIPIFSYSFFLFLFSHNFSPCSFQSAFFHSLRNTETQSFFHLIIEVFSKF